MVHNGSKCLQKNAIKGATKIWVQNGATKIRVQKKRIKGYVQTSLGAKWCKISSRVQTGYEFIHFS